ncbi:glycoside hydrolase family 36 protein [Streptomyces sp. TLI_171]|uniref:glycoside hydrolase family 36 protein n=1 Tax=Streptomyces sp. TLI_171 TaxID=1938859 RepID=UPI000C17B07D|nr:glycoside hydrolase family 36 protein [Streptomyces sp. TLI_171]RKE22806.1 alpha-galactosidase [Streptomyces sp. TLI_171]
MTALSWDGSAPPSGRTETSRTVDAGPLALRITAIGSEAEPAVTVTPLDVPGTLLIEARGTGADLRLRAEWQLPCTGATGYWTPNTNARWLPPSWALPREASLPKGAPVGSLVGAGDAALCTFAVGELVRPVTIGEGAVEETGRYSWWVEHDGPQLSLRLDLTRRHFADTVRESAAWWATLAPARDVPEAAFEPVFCTWYALHLAMTSADVEQLAELAAPLGFRSLIVDDGWQTDERTRSYATTGDWEPAPKDFPDFAGHVRRIQAIGLNYLLWHAVPFVGDRSRAAERLAGHTLAHLPLLETHLLDPRSATVRAHQVERLAAAVEQHGVDGLKVDFVDTFARKPPPGAAPHTASPEADCATVAEGVQKLLAELDARLRATRPEVLVEHRQDYLGPGLWPYATMVRATDCPHNAVENRVRTADLRLTAGPLAVHADPLTWHPGESPEQIAVLLQSVLFATAQVSVDLGAQSAEQLTALAFWLSVMKEHRTLLQRGELRPHRPELAYPLIEARHGAQLAFGRYAPLPLRAAGDWELLLVANADQDTLVRVEFDRPPGAVELLVQDCLGGAVARAQTPVGGTELSVRVPTGGLLTLRR